MTANVLKDKKEYLDAGMDDVLSKPLAVPALTAVIRRFWDSAPATTLEAGEPHAHDLCELLDTEMLQQYLDLVGPQLIDQSLAVFEKMMPGYLSVLESNMTRAIRKGLPKRDTRLKAPQAPWDCVIYSSWRSRFRRRRCRPGGTMCRSGSTN